MFSHSTLHLSLLQVTPIVRSLNYIIIITKWSGILRKAKKFAVCWSRFYSRLYNGVLSEANEFSSYSVGRQYMCSCVLHSCHIPVLFLYILIVQKDAILPPERKLLLTRH